MNFRTKLKEPVTKSGRRPVCTWNEVNSRLVLYTECILNATWRYNRIKMYTIRKPIEMTMREGHPSLRNKQSQGQEMLFMWIDWWQKRTSGVVSMMSKAELNAKIFNESYIGRIILASTLLLRCTPKPIFYYVMTILRRVDWSQWF